jgi:hypothetical protein
MTFGGENLQVPFGLALGGSGNPQARWRFACVRWRTDAAGRAEVSWEGGGTGRPEPPESDMNMQIAIAPIIALIAGILILVRPRLLNYIVAIYLIVIGLLGLTGAAGMSLR